MSSEASLNLGRSQNGVLGNGLKLLSSHALNLDKSNILSYGNGFLVIDRLITINRWSQKECSYFIFWIERREGEILAGNGQVRNFTVHVTV